MISRKAHAKTQDKSSSTHCFLVEILELTYLSETGALVTLAPDAEFGRGA